MYRLTIKKHGKILGDYIDSETGISKRYDRFEDAAKYLHKIWVDAVRSRPGMIPEMITQSLDVDREDYWTFKAIIENGWIETYGAMVLKTGIWHDGDLTIAVEEIGEK